MKKIAIAFGILACLAVLSLLLTSASAQGEEEEEEDWLLCPSGWGDRYLATMRDPAVIYYMRDVTGIGNEDITTTASTHGCFDGVLAELNARGSGEIYRDRQIIQLDSDPDNPKLCITSTIDKSYGRVDFSGTLGVFDNTLTGEMSTRNYEAGAVVSEKYRNTYDIAGDYTHEGSGNSSRTQLDRAIFGTARFGVTVKNPEEWHQTIMRSRETHTGLYNISREVNVVVYP